MRRSSRRWVAAVTLLGFFGLQSALAAHACARAFDLSGGLPQAAMSPTGSSHCATTEPDSDQQQAGLCLEHCTKGKQANSSVASTDAPAPASVAFFTVQHSIAVAIANSWSPPQLQSRNNSPPPLVLSQRLRI
jgi:hypothetical protein